MKICFWVSHVATVGGVQRVTSVIANELSKFYDITILTNDNDKELEKNIYNLEERVNVVKQSDNFNKALEIPIVNKVLKRLNKITGIFNNEKYCKLGEKIYFPNKAKRAVINYFNKKEYDVIVAVQGYNAILLASVASELKAKCIGWQHNSFDAYFRTKNEYFWNQDFLFKKYLKYLNEYITLNEIDSAKINKAFGIKSKYIYNPKSFSTEYKSSSSEKRFLAAGRFCRAKGFDRLIEAAKIFVETEKEWKIYLVGDGGEKEKLENKIKEYRLEDYFILPGYTDDIQSYMKKSSVLLLPSRWEGMPMIVLEALEMGLPTIAFNISAVKPLISDGKEGIVVESKDGIKAYANAMIDVAKDRNRLIQMSDNAKKKAMLFSIDNIIPEWCDLINELFC